MRGTCSARTLCKPSPMSVQARLSPLTVHGMELNLLRPQLLHCAVQLVMSEAFEGLGQLLASASAKWQSNCVRPSAVALKSCGRSTCGAVLRRRIERCCIASRQLRWHCCRPVSERSFVFRCKHWLHSEVRGLILLVSARLLAMLRQ